jgi:hypothetical protein
VRHPAVEEDQRREEVADEREEAQRDEHSVGLAHGSLRRGFDE